MYIGLALAILTNISAFFIFNIRIARKDNQFLMWVATDVGNKFSKLIISTIGLIITFKIWRLLYGRLFNKRYFSAKFRSNDTIFKPVNIVSIINFLIASVPVLASAALTVRLT